jgi:hypothetical protein
MGRWVKEGEWMKKTTMFFGVITLAYIDQIMWTATGMILTGQDLIKKEHATNKK